PDHLVAGHEREATAQDAGVLLVIGAAETAGFDAQEPVVFADRGAGQVVRPQPPRLLQHERPHGLPAPGSGGTDQAVTSMLPFMKLWIWQWYLTVAALAGSVILPDVPLATSPESKVLSSAVTVWVVVSSFLIVIVDPAGALSGSGENLKSLIVITVPDVPPPDVAFAAVPALVFLSLPQEVEPSATAATASTARERAIRG